MLKLDKEYVLRQIGDDYVIVPVGKAALDFNGMKNSPHASIFIGIPKG